MTSEQKKEIIENYRLSESDTGSTEVKIALLTFRINDFNEHLKQNKNDHHSRRGLMKMVGHRKALLTYLEKKSYERYKELIGKLNLRK